jgi:hypothetical protein
MLTQIRRGQFQLQWQSMCGSSLPHGNIGACGVDVGLLKSIVIE